VAAPMSRFLPCVIVTASLALLSGPCMAQSQMAMAPDFSRADMAGTAVHLSDYRGKLVLLNFWASWCGPCRDEMPLFSRWQRQYGARGLQVIGVSMDDDAASARKFLKQHPVSYPVVMGDAKFGESFGGVLGLPATYLINADGRIVARFEGEIDLKNVGARIQMLLSHMTR